MQAFDKACNKIQKLNPARRQARAGVPLPSFSSIKLGPFVFLMYKKRAFQMRCVQTGPYGMPLNSATSAGATTPAPTSGPVSGWRAPQQVLKD